MTDKKRDETHVDTTKQGSSHFHPGGKFAPIHDRYEYEEGIKSLPAEEQELVKELTNFADLCSYFEKRDGKLDPSIATAMNQAASLPLQEKIARIREINQRLMQAVDDAGEGAQFRN